MRNETGIVIVSNKLIHYQSFHLSLYKKLRKSAIFALYAWVRMDRELLPSLDSLSISVKIRLSNQGSREGPSAGTNYIRSELGTGGMMGVTHCKY